MHGVCDEPTPPEMMVAEIAFTCTVNVCVEGFETVNEVIA